MCYLRADDDDDNTVGGVVMCMMFCGDGGCMAAAMTHKETKPDKRGSSALSLNKQKYHTGSTHTMPQQKDSSK